MISLWNLFFLFAKIGAFTIGGGYVMLPLIQEEIHKKKWLEDDDVLEIITLAQSLPGILAINTALLIGTRIRGLKGAVIAAIGAALPSFLAILLIAIFFRDLKYDTRFANLFLTIRPVAIAIILSTMLKMALQNNKNLFYHLISLLCFSCVLFFNVSPIIVIMVTIVVSVIVHYIRATWHFPNKSRDK